MKGSDVKDMQRRIDEGIMLAQRRLAVRAREDNQSLVVCKEGQIIEIVPDVDFNEDVRMGDPLYRYRYKKMP